MPSASRVSAGPAGRVAGEQVLEVLAFEALVVLLQRLVGGALTKGLRGGTRDSGRHAENLAPWGGEHITGPQAALFSVAKYRYLVLPSTGSQQHRVEGGDQPWAIR